MKYDAILFDLDGTLVNSIDLYGEAVKEMFAQVGVSFSPRTFRAFYTGGVKLKDWLAKFNISENKIDVLRPLRDGRYIELLREKVEWIDGAEDLIATLKDNYPLGLVTGSWKSYVDAIDSRLDVTPHFRTVITAEHMGDFGKPHPHSLLLAADTLKVDPEKCIYIGDQLFDIEAAKNAGMASCCVRGTYTPKEAVKQADFVVEALEDLREIV